MSRKLLQSAILVMAVCGMVAMVALSAVSLTPTARAKNAAEFVLNFDGIETGVPKQITIHGMPIFLFRPNATQWQSIRFMDQHVWNQAMPGWNEELNLFAYVAVDTHRNFLLQHHPSENQLSGRDRFRREGYLPWQGGYWSAGGDSSYDYAGRAIKTHAYSFIGFTPPLDNLMGIDIQKSGRNWVIRYPNPYR